MHDDLLDLRGLKCPLPALKTRAALLRLVPGQTLTVLCTDPLAAIDVPNVVREEAAELAGQSRNGAVLAFRIRRPRAGAGTAG